jgi:hypothetical protein
VQLKKHDYVTWEAHKQQSVSIVLYHQAIASAAWLMTVGGRVRLSPRAPWILRNSLVRCSCATESDGIMESTSGWVPGTWNLWMNTDCHARWDLLLGVTICSTRFTSVALRWISNQLDAQRYSFIAGVVRLYRFQAYAPIFRSGSLCKAATMVFLNFRSGGSCVGSGGVETCCSRGTHYSTCRVVQHQQ